MLLEFSKLKMDGHEGSVLVFRLLVVQNSESTIALYRRLRGPPIASNLSSRLSERLDSSFTHPTRYHVHSNNLIIGICLALIASGLVRPCDPVGSNMSLDWMKNRPLCLDQFSERLIESSEIQIRSTGGEMCFPEQGALGMFSDDLTHALDIILRFFVHSLACKAASPVSAVRRPKTWFRAKRFFRLVERPLGILEIFQGDVNMC